MTGHKAILLVDDDEDDQFFFVDTLKEFAPDIACFIASNGMEAMELLQSAALLPSLIFLDLNMPVMNGFECLDQIKREKRFREIPVIIYSTSSDPITVKKINEMGANAFFRKPSDFPSMHSKLQQLLNFDFAGSTQAQVV